MLVIVVSCTLVLDNLSSHFYQGETRSAFHIKHSFRVKDVVCVVWFIWSSRGRVIFPYYLSTIPLLYV